MKLEKGKGEQTMIYLKFPPIEKIQGYKTYGNKYLKFWRNTVTKDDYIAVVLCGERVCFPATQDGVDKAEKWVNEKRAEIAEALKLCKVYNDGYDSGLETFAERCKEYARACKASGYDGIGENDIDELLKEFKK